MFEQLEEPQEKTETDYSGAIIGAAMLPVVLVFDHFGRFDMGLNVALCLLTNILAIRFRWNLRKHFWFWGVMVLVLAIELALVVRIQWPQHWVPGVSLLPIGVAGVLIAFGAIRLVENIAKADYAGSEH